MARVDVIHRQQHQRNGGAAKQGTGFQHHRAALALIPKQASHRRQHDHQEGDAAAADVSLAALDGGPDIVEPGVAQQGRCADPLIANRRDGVALQQQLHAVKIHAAVTEIGRGQLSHRKERNAEPRRCRDKAGVAAPFVLPHRRQREHPEQQRVGAEDRFHRAGRRADGEPAGLIGAVQRRSTAHDEKRQHIVHGLRCAADAGADGHGNGKQTGAEHNALPPVQLSAAGKRRNAQRDKQQVAPQHHVDAAAEQKARQRVGPDEQRPPGAIAANVRRALLVAKVPLRAAVGDDAANLAIIKHFVVVHRGGQPDFVQRGAAGQEVKSRKEHDCPQHAEQRIGGLFEKRFDFLHRFCFHHSFSARRAINTTSRYWPSSSSISRKMPSCTKPAFS